MTVHIKQLQLDTASWKTHNMTTNSSKTRQTNKQTNKNPNVIIIIIIKTLLPRDKNL